MRNGYVVIKLFQIHSLVFSIIPDTFCIIINMCNGYDKFILLLSPGWKSCIKEKSSYYGNLHTKLIIVIPKSGRSFGSCIPGCEEIPKDAEVVFSYLDKGRECAKLGKENTEEHKMLPLLCIFGERRIYTMNIYKIDAVSNSVGCILRMILRSRLMSFDLE